jgi:CheY-like chemotaxis protein
MLRLVVCDDDERVLEVLFALCERALLGRDVEVEVVAAGSFDDALVALQAGSGPVKLVTDYNLDRLTGCDLIRQAGESGCSLGNVAIVSGRLAGSDRSHDCAGSLVRSWSKPVGLHDMRQILDWILV